MSWASRRRTEYIAGVAAFFAVVIGVPTLIYLYHAPTCTDGIQNQDETAVDKGGACPIADENQLAPHAVLWARAFKVRAGVYSAVAYIENPNANAGVLAALYRFRLYDVNNVLVAEREGVASIMPGDITPIFEGGIDTGSRDSAHAQFEFTGPLEWRHLKNSVHDVSVHDTIARDVDTVPRVTTIVHNAGVTDVRNVQLVSVVFDIDGNAFAASGTLLPLVGSDHDENTTFTWPTAFDHQVSRIDVIPVATPTPY